MVRTSRKQFLTYTLDTKEDGQLSVGTEQLLAIIDQMLAAFFLRLKDNECNGISFR